MWDMEALEGTEVKRKRDKARLALSIGGMFGMTPERFIQETPSPTPVRERDTRSEAEVQRRLSQAEARRERKRQRNLRQREAQQ